MLPVLLLLLTLGTFSSSARSHSCECHPSYVPSTNRLAVVKTPEQQPQLVPVYLQLVPVNPQYVPVNPQSRPVNPQPVPVNPQPVSVNPQPIPVNSQPVPVNPQPQPVPVNPRPIPIDHPYYPEPVSSDKPIPLPSIDPSMIYPDNNIPYPDARPRPPQPRPLPDPMDDTSSRKPGQNYHRMGGNGLSGLLSLPSAVADSLLGGHLKVQFE